MTRSLCGGKPISSSSRRTFSDTATTVSATAYDPYAARRRNVAKMVQIVWLLFGLVETVLAIRFVLRLLAANPDAPFAAFMYTVWQAIWRATRSAR